MHKGQLSVCFPASPCWRALSLLAHCSGDFQICPNPPPPAHSEPGSTTARSAQNLWHQARGFKVQLCCFLLGKLLNSSSCWWAHLYTLFLCSGAGGLLTCVSVWWGERYAIAIAASGSRAPGTTFIIIWSLDSRPDLRSLKKKPLPPLPLSSHVSSQDSRRHTSVPSSRVLLPRHQPGQDSVKSSLKDRTGPQLGFENQPPQPFIPQPGL